MSFDHGQLVGVVPQWSTIDINRYLCPIGVPVSSCSVWRQVDALIDLLQQGIWKVADRGSSLPVLKIGWWTSQFFGDFEYVLHLVLWRAILIVSGFIFRNWEAAWPVVLSIFWVWQCCAQQNGSPWLEHKMYQRGVPTGGKGHVPNWKMGLLGQAPELDFAKFVAKVSPLDASLNLSFLIMNFPFQSSGTPTWTEIQNPKPCCTWHESFCKRFSMVFYWTGYGH